MDNTLKDRSYTFADYKTFSENERVELIDGRIYAITPSPSRIHQEIITEMVTIINNYIKAKKGNCKVYPAPFDVILDDNINNDIENSRNVVQPDISVICDKNKLNDKGCIGSPDLIVEIVSPYNPNSDYVRKLNLYDAYKVHEYWIVNPMNESILVYKLCDNSYAAPETYTFKDKIKVGVFDGLVIDFNEISL